MLLNPREILIEKNSLSITQGKIMPTLSESHIRHIHNLDILDFLRAQCAEEMPSALSDETLTVLRKKVEAHIKATYLSGASARGSETDFESVDGVELTRKIFLRRIN
ncbi:MAG: hypothetical protein B6D41_02845, partial [Chloroflexi bacterium UTCFX4]